MRSKHRKTLERAHGKPTPSDIRWDEVRAMLQACDVQVLERSGSRVGLRKKNERIVIHRPHPRSVVGRETVRDIAAFLRAAGVEP
ncbi:MAG: type II toxin-antitoxin system HicA family toxin [Gemmatimonadales bacterium]|nr:type II toxin-antitoxin system HicA family toxin [Gemmatimonadales bacterium]MYG49955.1 type II toxin-antitoxin system HicA family toxin [Gemmatimonadales bacterium]MYK01391.1 type II toxin-antitoxin system HicA family toxin [Candidatus Palauibacter ramosifaciens]